jgi:hypothetical protein
MRTCEQHGRVDLKTVLGYELGYATAMVNILTALKKMKHDVDNGGMPDRLTLKRRK